MHRRASRSAQRHGNMCNAHGVQAIPQVLREILAFVHHAYLQIAIGGSDSTRTSTSLGARGADWPNLALLQKRNSFA